MLNLVIEIVEVILIIVSIIFIISGLTNIISWIPYVPSKVDYLQDIIKEISKNKKGKELTLYDLGSGDGRTLFLAEKYGFQAKGYENCMGPFLYAYFKKIITRSKVKIVFGSFFKADIENANIIFIYLLPYVFEDLVKKIKKECRKGTIIISSGFQVPGLSIVNFKERIKSKNWPSVYYYEV